MGYLYIDGKAAYSDPATSGLVYMKADGTWSAPDSAYKYMDATSNWSAPELKPASLDTASPNQLKAIAAEVAAGSKDYDSWLGTHTKSISFGSYGSTKFQLVAINHDDTSTSGTWTAVPTPAIWPLVFMADNQLGESGLELYSSTYGWSAMNDDCTGRDYLRALYSSMDSSWASVLSEVRAPIVTMRDLSTSVYQMAAGSPIELFAPSLMELGITTTSYSPQEGKTFGWFSSNNNNESRVRHDSSGSTSVRYMTRTGNRYGSATSSTAYTQMMCISTTGTYESVAVDTVVAMVPCFVIS